MWEHVSRRSSLEALALASSIRTITKADKEKENNKKSSPTKGVRFPGSAQLIDNKSAVNGFLTNNRMRRNTVRHHLERTTGHGLYPMYNSTYHILIYNFLNMVQKMLKKEP